MDELSERITEEELREFLEADFVGDRADPAFKRKLRGRLWEFLQAKLARKSRGRVRSRDARAETPSRPNPPGPPR
ncbi:MAG: hypothetical protein ACE5FL_00515 [Myxococcota bacterium]